MANFRPSLITLALAAAGLTSNIALAAEPQKKPDEAKQEIQQVVPATNKTEKEKITPAASDAKSKTDTAVKKEVDRGEVMVVTGYAGSIFRSIEKKRNADIVSEHLSSDDLGALPDVSIADALTRLPGVAAVRTGGEASEINIRGMAGGFVFTTMNGREQVSTTGTRSVEFSQYPSELISSAAVYKSQKASLLEGGIAGTVELTTASALDNKEENKFNVNVRGMYNDRANQVYDAKSTGHRISFSYQGKFLEDTVGLSVGYARLFQPSVATQFIGFAPNALQDVDGVAGDVDGPDSCPECEWVSEGFEMQHLGGKETRNSYMAVVEWAPNDSFTLKADAFISNFDRKAFARGFRVKFDGALANIVNPNIVDNVVIGGTFNRSLNSNTRVEIANDDNTDKDKMQNYGLNGEWLLTNQTTLSVDLSHSATTSDFRNALVWGLVAEDANAAVPAFDNNVSIAYQLRGGNLPDLGFNQSFTDLNRVMLSKYGIFPFENSDEVNAIKIDGQHDLIKNDFFSSFEAGVRYSERRYSNDRSVYQYGADNQFLSSQPPLQLDSSLATVVGFSGAFSGFPNYLAIDIPAALNAWFPGGVGQPAQTWGADANGVINNSTAWSVLQSGDVFEDILSGYFMANIDTEMFGTEVTGNIGLRVVKSDQSATTLTDVGGNAELGAQNIRDEVGLINDQYAPAIEGVNYTDYLPSLNLNFRIDDNSLIRVAAAKVMSRAPINRLASDASITFNDEGKMFFSSNNSPFLRPFYANQYDLSYEYYFEDSSGAVSAALFYKDIKSFIQNITIPNFDFAANGFVVPQYVPGKEPDNADGLPPVPVIPGGSYSIAVNNRQGGYIRGLELAFTKKFDDLPGIWSGLGVSGSYSYTESDVTFISNFSGPTFNSTFPGLSKQVFNGTIFWSYEGFDTHLNVRYRDNFVSDQVAIDTQTVNFDAETVIDYQASYNIDDNTSVLFQVNNLTDEPTKTFFGRPEITGTIQFFGRQFFLGANYKF